MTPTEFRKLALSFPETEESSHMNHPDFRASGKIFATLSNPDESRGMVQLTPVEQEMFMNAEPEVFSPAAGAWDGEAQHTSILGWQRNPRSIKHWKLPGNSRYPRSRRKRPPNEW